MKQISWILVLFVSCNLFAQNGWDFGSENKQVAQSKYIYAQNLIKAKRFKEAQVNIYWLLNKTPNLHKNLYMNATKMYEGLEKVEKDVNQKKVYQDSILALYDKRIEFFGEEAKVLNYKGMKSYYFLQRESSKQDDLYTEFKKTIQLNGSKTFDTNVLNYFRLVQKQKKKGNLTDEQVLTAYEESISVLDIQIAEKPEKAEKINKKKSQIDDILAKTVVVDCDFIQNNLGPKYTAEPNLKLAKRIYKLSIANKCISNDLFEKVSYFIVDKEPTLARYKQLGNIQYLKQKNYTKATTSYTKALELAAENEEKGEILILLSKVSAAQGKKDASRTYAKKSIALGYKTSECYTLIGNLYMGSFKQCIEKGNPVKNRSIYIAAYEQYKKAGNTTKMNTAKAQFPSMEEIFNQNKTIGDKVNTGCWVNETVALDKRPK